ncbi:hypothetical protein [Streptomyces sp. UNOC14_S4]|uniref:hypothetical protein n=1 Tax=Streptomyces sp. UNOC14_S4 TaxID=2872340 RepID=UPI001E3D3D35|nr:hypothetical protein [Streptomyces sp. UNOC14_S4]MCC3769812.1 hypothetical protein [Streptomyces sp. UNOC14_S4]
MPSRAHAQKWFAHAGVVLLPAGTVWDAIRVSGGMAGNVLAAGIDGPVIRDRDELYFLVRPGAAGTWTTPGGEGLGAACYVAVPAPECTSGPGVHWAQAPDGNGALIDAERLAALIQGVYGEAGQ